MSITAINVRNQFRGRIKEIIEGPVVSEIDVETPSGLVVTSVITTRSVRELGLAMGKGGDRAGQVDRGGDRRALTAGRSRWHIEADLCAC
jgi:molybdopterin-binding protein